MSKYLYIFTLFFVANSYSQSFAPAAGESGSTAIHMDSSIIVNWGAKVQVERGYLDISNPGLGLVDFGDSDFAEGKANGDSFNIVSLGDSGVAIITFQRPIKNGLGFDFAVFENGFADDYIELAFVEVSSDGEHFVRFPSTSEASTSEQIGPYSFSDCRFFNNLAGKYKQEYGTPFDLEELKDSNDIDLMNITHVKLIDVVGTINTELGSFDQFGNVINDLYPTPFSSGGFDLDAVAVINEGLLSYESVVYDNFKIYPNPTKNKIHIKSKGKTSVSIVNLFGSEISEFSFYDEISYSFDVLPNGIYFVKLKNNNSYKIVKVVVEK